jgi:hypothetical protein
MVFFLLLCCFSSNSLLNIDIYSDRRFGFANPEAIAAGETGTACRGEEHDITLVWSITSGKRIVLADGQEVHYSSSRNTTFDYSWTMRGNHVMKLVAHANPPMSATPGFRQYDFFVDGMSFFAFPKLFRLGLGSGEGRPALAPSQLAESSHRYRQKSAEGIASIEAPHNPDEVRFVVRAMLHLYFLCLSYFKNTVFLVLHLGGTVFARSDSPISG